MDPLRETINLDPPVPFSGNVYLGCGQYDISPPMDLIKQKHNLFISTFIPALADQKDTAFQPNRVRAYEYDMSGHADSSVKRYLELAKVDIGTLKPVQLLASMIISSLQRILLLKAN